MLQFMPIPLYGFALQQKQDAMNSQKVGESWESWNRALLNASMCDGYPRPPFSDPILNTQKQRKSRQAATITSVDGFKNKREDASKSA